MFNFTLNGEKLSLEDMNLLTYLREDRNITSVKNGCAEGACGTCMILVDGKPMRACIVRTSRLDGKAVMTIEGIPAHERDIFAYCFAKAGAVQCGFCIPAMVISAKGLIDTNNNPTRNEVKRTLRGNICRCTGYVKIEDAILESAKMIREGKKAPEYSAAGKVGENMHRVDAIAKTLGVAKYVDDLRFPDMVYGSALRTPHPRVLVKSINIDKAQAHPGVVAIYTARDITGLRFISHLPPVKDWAVMIAEGEETRYLGDSLALVVADTPEILQEALSLIEIDYDILKPVTTAAEALEEGAPLIHAKGNLLKKEILKRGDSDKALKNSKHVVTYTYTTPPTEHAFLETECAIGMPDGDGIILYTSGQSIYDEQRETSEVLGIPADKVRVISAYVGGGFGGKEDMSVQHHAGFLAYKSQRTVKVLLSRKESLIIHPKRHGAIMEFTTGCDAEGNLTAMKAVITMDTGAYASLGGPVLQRACTHAAGPYNYQNIDITGLAVYTNNPPCGAFRGFGVTQSAFATEANITKLAEKVGISPWEFRYKNAIRPGQVLPNGQIADEGTALVETLEAVKAEYESAKYAGIACAFKNAGLGVGVPDVGRCRIAINNDKIEVYTSASCIGQGVDTILLQLVCEETGAKANDVKVMVPDTSNSPDCGTTTASRQTVFAGESCLIAARLLTKDLKSKSFKELNGKEYYGEYAPETDPIGSTKENPYSHVAYGYATQVVIIDEEGKLEKVIAAHDVGRAINPINVEGQIEGGVVMGLGYGLTEDYPLQECVPSARFGTLGLFRAEAVPPIDSIIIEKNKNNELVHGAKGVGEITTIPTAPAVQAAYYKLDGEFRTSLPMENTFYRKNKK